MNELTTIADALRCGVNDWPAIWGDPLLTGTIFSVAYGLTALLIFLAARNATARERLYWRLCGGLFVFQLFNTHLDLHALIWTTGRCLAHAQGRYEHRREVQALVLIGFALLLLIAIVLVLMMFLRSIARNILLTLGVMTALGFTLVKGVNYHGLNEFYSRQLGLFYIADLIEFSGIVMAFGAAIASRKTA